MSLLLDGLILLVLPLFAWRGYKRGGFMSICGFLMLIVAFLGATFLSANLSEPMSRLVQPPIKQGITSVIEKGLGGNGILLEKPPPEEEESPYEQGEDTPPEEEKYISIEYAFMFLENEVSFKKYQGFIQSAKEILTAKGEDYGSSATEAISSFIAKEVTRVFIFSISFSLVLFVWTLSTKTLNLVFKLPILVQINKGLGAFMGFLMGVFLVYIVVWVVKGNLISWQEIDQTIFFQFFANHTPLDFLAQFSEKTLNL